MDTQALINKYNRLLKKQKEAESKIIELRTQYKVAKENLTSLTDQLKEEYNVSTVEEAKELLEQYKIDLEMDLNSLEENVLLLNDI